MQDDTTATVDARFFEAAARGELLIGHCAGCGAHHSYPRAHCPHCFETDSVTLVAAQGGGEVYSFSTLYTKGAEAYTVAYVLLDEGISVLTHLRMPEGTRPAIGVRVRVAFEPVQPDGPVVPVFVPA